MEKLTKIGKDFDETFNELLTENNLLKDDVIYKSNKVKKGLFKGESVEVNVYKKNEIYEYVKKFLKEVINNLGLEVKFETTKLEDNVIIKMYSDNNNVLIGREGNTLKAFETIVSQKIQLETGIYFKISLDVENYKEKKIKRLERLAKQLARDVVKTKTSIKMENMNAYERRICHNVLTNFKGVTTKSEGEDPNRHIVISPSK